MMSETYIMLALFQITYVQGHCTAPFRGETEARNTCPWNNLTAGGGTQTKPASAVHSHGSSHRPAVHSTVPARQVLASPAAHVENIRGQRLPHASQQWLIPRGRACFRATVGRPPPPWLLRVLLSAGARSPVCGRISGSAHTPLQGAPQVLQHPVWCFLSPLSDPSWKGKSSPSLKHL